MIDISKDKRFAGLTPFEKKVYLATPTMHGEEREYMVEAYDTNWMSTVGANINEVERITCEKVGCGYSVALSSGTAALHLAMKLAGERLFGQPAVGHGALEGKKVFCSDMTFDATVNPIAYEGGEAVFIDTETKKVYQVKGLTQSWEEMIPNLKPPFPIDATLLPYNECIISDGLVAAHHISFGPDYREEFKHIYDTANYEGKVLTTLSSGR